MCLETVCGASQVRLSEVRLRRVSSVFAVCVAMVLSSHVPGIGSLHVYIYIYMYMDTTK